MRIGIIGDLHLGCCGNSNRMREFMQEYILKKMKMLASDCVLNVVILGDVIHNRSTIHMLDLHFITKTLKQCIKDLGINLTVLVGNHDSHYKNTLAINYPEMLMSDYCNVVSEPVDYNGIDIFPWICDDNEFATNDLLERSFAKYCFGHFELIGFQFSENIYSKDGMDASLLKRYDKVISGHYHVKQSAGNIDYVGTPYSTSWTEYNTKKGIHILDTNTGELKFIENAPEDEIFMKVEFDGTPKFDIKDLKNKIVQCNIIKKATPAKMRLFFQEMGDIDVVKLTYIDSTETEKTESDVIELDEVGSNINETIRMYGSENEINQDVVDYALGVISGV